MPCIIIYPFSYNSSTQHQKVKSLSPKIQFIIPQNQISSSNLMFSQSIHSQKKNATLIHASIPTPPTEVLGWYAPSHRNANSALTPPSMGSGRRSRWLCSPHKKSQADWEKMRGKTHRSMMDLVGLNWNMIGISGGDFFGRPDQ